MMKTKIEKLAEITDYLVAVFLIDVAMVLLDTF